MEVPYKQMSNEALPPSYNFTNPNIAGNPNVQISYPATSAQPKILKQWKLMHYLAIVETILGILSLIFGSTCVGTAVSVWGYPIVCNDGTGISVGVLCIITGAIGLGALSIPTGRRCMLVAYFVLSIFCAVGAGVLLIISSARILSIFSSAWAANDHDWNNQYKDEYGAFLALLILNVILVIVAINHLILSIISSTLMCYNWTCCSNLPQPPVTTIYQENIPHEILTVSNEVRHV